jgi:predicted amidohydrolase
MIDRTTRQGRSRRAFCLLSWASTILATATLCPAGEEPAPRATAEHFRESFDDENLPDRGWYDGTTFAINGDKARDGGCLEYHWEAGTSTPSRSSAARRLFEPSESVYLRVFMRLSPDWGWTGRPYHPHLIQFMTTENDRFHGPASSRLTVYVEANEGKLRLAAQDIQNRDAPHGLTQGPLRGGYNGTFFDSDEALFDDDEWHSVEALFQLNSLDPEQGTPRHDGVVQAWFDGELVVDRSDVILRSADYPDMKFNQVLLAPYFGPGLLPHEQTMWLDDLVVGTARPESEASATTPRALIKVAAAQPRNRTIDFRLSPAEALDRVDQSITELETIVREAGEAGCQALVLPEDTLGLLNWEAANPELLGEVLPPAVDRMLERLGQEAARHGMSLVLCNDAIEEDGLLYNVAFLIGPDGREIGRYHKVNLPLTEQARTRGQDFPVFPTSDLGTVGMLICYDMVFPEAARALALQGADVVIHSTLGGAAFGDDDISLAAFRTRAAENFIYLVVSQRGQGSMIISPKGKVLATAEGPDSLAVAEIDPFGGREGGDAMNTQPDLRGRIFRERVPGAYGILTDPEPPVLDKVSSNVTAEEAIRIMATVLTTGEERFNRANELARQGKTDEAIQIFEQLCVDCRTSWIDRAARARIRALRSPSPAGSDNAP